MRHYVLVSHDRITVEHRWRASDGYWKTEILLSLGGTLSLGAIECTLDLADIYEGLYIDPSISLLPSSPDPSESPEPS